MPSWTPDNLEAHVAKHVLGSPSEAWEELLTEPEVLRGWRARASEARCRADRHPSCPEPETCGATARPAAEPYRALAELEWTFAQTHGLHVDTFTGRRKLERVGAGPRAVLVAAVCERGRAHAKTAYRDDSGSRDRLRRVVRKLRGLASTGHAGLTGKQRLHLESLLMVPTAHVDDPHVIAVFEALSQPFEKVTP